MSSNSTSYLLGLVLFALLPILAALKGLMIPANITLLVPAAAFFVMLAGRWRTIGSISISDFAMMALVVYMMLRSLASLNTILEQPADYGLHAISLLIVCPFMYFVGRIVAQNLSTNQSARLLAINLIIVIGYLALSVVSPEFLRQRGLAANSYYQYMGDGLAVAALLAWGYGYRAPFYWPYIITAFSLISIGSRASAVAYVIAMAFSNLRFLVTASLVAAPVGLWFLTAIERGAGLDWANQFRVLSTFLDFYTQDAEDASFSERQQFFDNAMNVINEHPLTGKIAYEVQGGVMGEYVHNALHLWANFGIVALLLMALVVAGGLLGRRPNQTAGKINYPFPLLVFVAAELMFFRHPENIVLFFALGALATLYAQAPQQHEKAPEHAADRGADDHDQRTAR